jgi:putative FmdB family regulatory protein
MPIYEYMCGKCNNEFEYLMLGGDSTVSCPDCDGEKVERLMSACSFKSGGGGDFSPSTSSSSCSGCTSSNCSTCH